MSAKNSLSKDCQGGSVLYVDAYDSFANNIIALLETTLGVQVTVVFSDTLLPDLPELLAYFDAVVLGPGPGNPTDAQGIELFGKIWQETEKNTLPVLGICLGFQSLAVQFGARLERLANPKHGVVTEIYHCGSKLFTPPDRLDVTQYHSLRVKIGHPVETSRSLLRPIELRSSNTVFSRTKTCPNLTPLAWDVSDSKNGGVLMAVKAFKKPYFGIQFHPESICSSEEAHNLIANWWLMAVEYNNEHGRISHAQKLFLRSSDVEGIFGLPRTNSLLEQAADCKSSRSSKSVLPANERVKRLAPRKVRTAKLDLGSAQVTELCEALEVTKCQTILLESAVSLPEVGRYSIIGLVIPGETKILEHVTQEQSVRISIAQIKPHGNLLKKTHKFELGETISTFLATRMEERKAVGGSVSSPFWGGLMGYLTYEMETEMPYARYGHIANGSKPGSDFVFADVERSLVIDHSNGKVYIQSLRKHDDEWIRLTKAFVRIVSSGRTARCLTSEQLSGFTPKQQEWLKFAEARLVVDPVIDQRHYQRMIKSVEIDRPKEEEYRKKVGECLEHIRAGDSYELCLTDQATIHVPKDPHRDIAWQLYKTLRKANPAPFAAYLHLNPTTIVSSSPERFLSWTRDGVCQLRPIKGTVKKTAEMDKHTATQLLNQPKEQAENLMIVDLIRHDLHGIVGSRNVDVKKLMSVEEYETVYQLVSVIEGRLPPQPRPSDSPSNSDSDTDPDPDLPPLRLKRSKLAPYTGIDVLTYAFPPGSMTGAPKLRSTQLLHAIENEKPRGPYSGVVGYMCAGGGGDFSVLIRCAYRYDEEIITKSEEKIEGDKGEREEEDRDEKRKYEVWRVGAGGAITALSDDRLEWEEMNAKLESTLTAFLPLPESNTKK